jgi:hypothetical protein
VAEGRAAGEPGHGDLGESSPDRHLHLHTDEVSAGRILHGDDPGGPLADDHPAMRDAELDGEGVPSDEIDRGHDDQHRARPGHGHELNPAEEVAEQERRRHDREHRPAERGDDGGDAAEPPGEYPADRPGEAHEEDDAVGEEPGAVPDDAGAGVGETHRGRVVCRVEVGRTRRRARRVDRRLAPHRAGPRSPRELAPIAHTACLSLGGGVSMSSWLMMLDAVTPSNSASGSSTRRWASTGSASAFTSSGIT